MPGWQLGAPRWPHELFGASGRILLDGHSGLLDTYLRPLRDCFGPLCVHLRPLDDHLGPLHNHLGPLDGHIGPLYGHLGPQDVHLEFLDSQRSRPWHI